MELMRGQVGVGRLLFISRLNESAPMNPISMNYQLVIKGMIRDHAHCIVEWKERVGSLYPTPATRDVIK